MVGADSALVVHVVEALSGAVVEVGFALDEFGEARAGLSGGLVAGGAAPAVGVGGDEFAVVVGVGFGCAVRMGYAGEFVVVVVGVGGAVARRVSLGGEVADSVVDIAPYETPVAANMASRCPVGGLGAIFIILYVICYRNYRPVAGK